MESEIAKQVLDLFDECTKILNGEFRDNEIFWLAYQRHKTIVARLGKLGFTVTTERHLNNKRETVLRGEVEIQKVNYILKLVPNSTTDDSYKSKPPYFKNLYREIAALGRQPTDHRNF